MIHVSVMEGLLSERIRDHQRVPVPSEETGAIGVVLVITGSSIRDEYIANTTAMLAQAGFIGLAPDIFSLQADTMSAEEKREVFAKEITDQRIFQDIRAGLHYLEGQPFVKPGAVGITGFCFGGRCALMFAAESKDVGAVVPFYGNPRTPPLANRTLDPLDVMNRIKSPVQGHYVRNDSDIPLLQVEELEQTLRTQGTPVEMFLYDAGYGFFAYERSSYNAEAAALAWSRTARFFKRHL